MQMRGGDGSNGGSRRRAGCVLVSYWRAMSHKSKRQNASLYWVTAGTVIATKIARRTLQLQYVMLITRIDLGRFGTARAAGCAYM
jgi:hypothetical protein